MATVELVTFVTLEHQRPSRILSVVFALYPIYSARAAPARSSYGGPLGFVVQSKAADEFRPFKL